MNLPSAAIPQVHGSRLTPAGAALLGIPPGTRVAVKVLHPNVAHTMLLDMRLLAAAAWLVSFIPALRELRLQDSVR